MTKRTYEDELKLLKTIIANDEEFLQKTQKIIALFFSFKNNKIYKKNTEEIIVMNSNILKSTRVFFEEAKKHGVYLPNFTPQELYNDIIRPLGREIVEKS